MMSSAIPLGSKLLGLSIQERGLSAQLVRSIIQYYYSGLRNMHGTTGTGCGDKRLPVRAIQGKDNP